MIFCIALPGLVTVDERTLLLFQRFSGPTVYTYFETSIPERRPILPRILYAWPEWH